jgi:hypothetical protein
MAKAKKAVDNSKHYRSTGYRLKDRVYNSIVDRYSKNGHKWTTSDTFVWAGGIYEATTMLSYIIQLLFFWFLAMLAIRIRGDGDALYGVIAIGVFILVRLGMLLKQLVAARKELEVLTKSFK